MLKALLKLFQLTAAMIILASCTSIKSEHYVGKIEPISDKEIGEETIWQFDDEVFHVKILSSEKAVGSQLKWNKEANKYETEDYDIIISKIGDALFLNIKKQNEKLYTILRLSPTVSDEIVLFSVDKDVLTKHIAEGKLKATAKDKHTYTLEMTKEELDNYMTEHMNTIFDFNASEIIKPIKAFKGKK